MCQHVILPLRPARGIWLLIQEAPEPYGIPVMLRSAVVTNEVLPEEPLLAPIGVAKTVCTPSVFPKLVHGLFVVWIFPASSLDSCAVRALTSFRPGLGWKV